MDREKLRVLDFLYSFNFLELILFLILQAQGDNLYDLLIALKNIDKNSKLLDERIEIVNDKFSRVSLADTDSIVNIRAELDDIISDWKEIQQQNNWIHAVPNIIEGSSLEQKVKTFFSEIC